MGLLWINLIRKRHTDQLDPQETLLLEIVKFNFVFNLLLCLYCHFVCLCLNFLFIVKMNEDQWMYEGIMHEEVDMDYENEEECGVNEPHVDCLDTFNTSQVIMFMTVSDLIK